MKSNLSSGLFDLKYLSEIPTRVSLIFRLIYDYHGLSRSRVYGHWWPIYFPLESMVMCVYGYDTIASNIVMNNDTVDFCVPRNGSIFVEVQLCTPFVIAYFWHHLISLFYICIHTVSCAALYATLIYPQTSNIMCNLIGNKIVDHSDVIGASPVGAAPTTSSFST